MATTMALWHLELTPGEKHDILVRRDFVITNAALGEEIVDANSRSVIKVTHSPINPRAFDMDSDSEYSDFDEDDDEELDSENEEEEAPKAKSPKSKKETKEDDDEDMDESDDDSDFSYELPAATAVIAALTPGKIEQATLNLTFVQEEVITLEVTGKNTVHLLGNYIDQSQHDHDHDHGDEYDSDGESYDSDEEYDDEDDMESMTSSQVADMEKMFGGKDAANRFEEINDEEDKEKSSKKLKRKAETQEVESPATKKAAAEEPLTKTAQKKLNKKLKLENGAAAATEAAAEKKAAPEKKEEKKVEKKEKPAEKKSNKKTLPSGLVIEDIKTGTGPVAKPGKKLGMRYIGKLTNGKQFDANTSGAPFHFTLGRGEVIKGWDQGVNGMAVGGERRLTIPASLAYGSQKIPGIPPNSTLVFEIKLVQVK